MLAICRLCLHRRIATGNGLLASKTAAAPAVCSPTNRLRILRVCQAAELCACACALRGRSVVAPL